MEIIDGKILDYDGEALLIVATYENVQRYAVRKYDDVIIGLPDTRQISAEQRKKAHALLNEIAEWMGDLPEYVKKLMKIDFIVQRQEKIAQQMFSLADCDVTTAKEFISYLIDFVLSHDVPLRVPITELCDDIEKTIYACLLNKKCVICGGKAELHHSPPIGAGADRKTINHLGRGAQPLCRKHHAEVEQIGQKVFDELYHIKAVPIDEKIAKVYKLNTKEKR